MNTPALDIDLEVVLDRFTLDVDYVTSQRVVGVFGPSGSGKTTLLEALAGLRRTAQGYIGCGDAVWLDTADGIHLPPEERGIGHVPQDHLLFPHRNVRRNLKAGADRARREGHDSTAVFRDVVRVLELDSLLGREVTGLSGGERQRVALGRALCSGPGILLLDEPLASLDVELRHRILPFLLRVRDEFDIPMVIVSHNPVELQALCDEVVVLREGKTVAQGTPVEVFTRAEVYPAASAEGFENILPAKITSGRRVTHTVHLGENGEGPEVSLSGAVRRGGGSLMIGIPASDILVATTRIQYLSARNQLAAVIERVDPAPEGGIITARVESMPSLSLVIEITPDAIEELALANGMRVYLVVKASSISVYS